MAPAEARRGVQTRIRALLDMLFTLSGRIEESGERQFVGRIVMLEKRGTSEGGIELER